MRYLRQSTAATVMIGPFLDASDGVAAEVALTLSQADIRLSKNGGAFAQSNNVAGATHGENGYYTVPLDTTDTNAIGRLRIAVSEAGAVPVWEDFTVLHANVYDVIFGTVALSTHTAAAVQALVAAGSVSGITGNVGGNVVGSVGSLVGHTPQSGDAYARIGSTGSGLTTLAPAATALSSAVWTGTKAGYLDAAISSVSTGGVSAGDIATAVWGSGSRTITGTVTLAAATHTGAVIPTVTTLTNLPAITTDWISAAGFSAGAVTKIQTGLSTGDTPGTTTLLGRLTNQRATNLDYLDASVSSIATGDVDASALATALIDEFNTTPPPVVLAPTGLDAIPMTLLDEPSTFREWAVWLMSCRFVRSRRVKATGIFSVYGSDRSTVVTRQTTTDNSTETTVGAFE